MNTKDEMKKSKIRENEISIDKSLYGDSLKNFDMDKHLTENSLLNWIELIENEKLYKAIKELPIKDQIFISYIVKEHMTQVELTNMYNIAQQNISKRLNRILNKIKLLIK